MAPPVIDHMPIDLVEAYFGQACPDTMTFADEQSLLRYLASQNK